MRKREDDKKTDEWGIQRKIRVVTEQHVMYVSPRARGWQQLAAARLYRRRTVTTRAALHAVRDVGALVC